MSEPAALEFPLRDEWHALNSPAGGGAGHGTGYFGQRYAIDFVRMDPTGTWYYPGGGRALLRHMTGGVPAASFFCWGQPVHAAAPGRVIKVADGWPDRRRVQLAWEMVRATFLPIGRVTAEDYRPLAGNCVVVEGPEGVALYAHLQDGSVRVTEGERIGSGETLGLVGNSGNSTMPHLHFQLMDGPDPLDARGLPFRFHTYERWTGEHWTTMTSQVPATGERVRFRGSHDD